MSKIPQLPPLARYYSPQGPPTAETQLSAPATPAVPRHPQLNTQLTDRTPSDTQAYSLRPVATPPIPLARGAFDIPVQSQSPDKPKRLTTAVVYCEANLGAIDGKTASGLVRGSEKYEILSVIDNEKAGLDAGMVLDGKPNAIPICRDLADALSRTDAVPDFFILREGIMPADLEYSVASVLGMPYIDLKGGRGASSCQLSSMKE